ncbi:MAG: glycosyltransferase family 4 protein [Acidobacteriia bacterium]|nr:glycosyltransferase family 4 protein [Terriglobia bacterium]
MENATVVFLRPLSIIHVDTEQTWRGGQESLLTLARGLRMRGYRQAIACSPSSILAERAQAAGFPIAKLGLGTADIVHAHGGRALTLAFWKTFGSGTVHRVVTRHVAFRPRNPWMHRLKYKWTCEGVIAVSDAVRRGLIETGVPSAKIEVIHTGIEAREPVPRDKSRFGLSEMEFVIGHMGAFTKEKGQDVAVAAAALLRESMPYARFILAGDGTLLNDLRRRATDNVTFPGFVGDHAAFFGALDLFIMPSRSEAWGLAALEAMAYGVPVIASDVGGLPEIVEPEHGGWLVPPGDPAALARAITEAASSPYRLHEQGQKARERARLFSVAQMVEQTEAFYARFIK